MDVDEADEYYDESDAYYPSYHEQNRSSEKMWGFLQPIGPEFHFMKLTKPKVLVGRAAECDYSLCTPNITSSSMIGLYSKIHFELRKHFLSKYSGEYHVYLQDHSRHGVFLNGVRVEKGVYTRLRSGTTIGLCTSISKALYFVDFGGTTDPVLPEPMSNYYRSGSLLGSGGFGQVFFSYSLIYQCPAATKRVRRSATGSGGDDADTARRELAEANLLREMKHRHIINVYDIIESKHFVYLLLEFAEGGDLYTRIKTWNKPDESWSKFYFRQVLDATKYLHSRNITHRDIKLQNMLLMSREELTVVKLADFGLSRVVGEQSLMNTLAGSPMYSPPEMVRGFHNRSVSVEYTKKVDLWSLGVSLFVLLAHYFPFSKKDGDLYEQIMTSAYTFDPERWSNISADARSLVTALLQEEELRSDVDAALAHPWLQNDPILEARIATMPSFERGIPDTGWMNVQT